MRFEPIEAAPRAGRVEDPARLRTASQFFLILLKVITIFSPLRIFLPVSARGVRRSARRTRVWTIAHAVARDEFVGAADPAERRHLSRSASCRSRSRRCDSRGRRHDDAAARAGRDPDLQRAREPSAARRRGLMQHAERARAGRRRSVAGRHRRGRRRAGARSIRDASSVLHRTGQRGFGRSYIDGMQHARRPSRSTSSARWTPTSRTIRGICRR